MIRNLLNYTAWRLLSNTQSLYLLQYERLTQFHSLYHSGILSNYPHSSYFDRDIKPNDQ